MRDPQRPPHERSGAEPFRRPAGMPHSRHNRQPPAKCPPSTRGLGIRIRLSTMRCAARAPL